MKHLILSIICAIMAIGCHAQIQVSEFTIAGDKTYKVVLLVKKEKPYKVSIACETKGGSKGEIWIKPNEVGKFRDALIAVKSKFDEWNQVASDNNVTETSKEMQIKFPKEEFVWGASTTFVGNEALKAKWIVNSGAKIVLCFAKVQASTNRFADEFFTLRFYSPEEVQNLINALSQDKIDEAIAKCNSSSLFN